MLTRNPKEFERVAHEWAVKYAGAPKKDAGEGSGGAKAETKEQKQKRSKEEEAAERAALYVCLHTSLTDFH
jgi:ubiquitin-conjugating enzyme (huntingtin interacting protein 2)